MYTHSADSTRSSTPKTELFHLPIDDANLMRRRLGVDLPWVCVGPTKIVCGRVRTGPNRDVIRPITRFSLTHDATQRWRQSAVVGGHDHSLYPPTAADDIYLHHRSAPCVSSIPPTVSIRLLQPASWEIAAHPTPLLSTARHG